MENKTLLCPKIQLGGVATNLAVSILLMVFGASLLSDILCPSARHTLTWHRFRDLLQYALISSSTAQIVRNQSCLGPLFQRISGENREL